MITGPAGERAALILERVVGEMAGKPFGVATMRLPAGGHGGVVRGNLLERGIGEQIALRARTARPLRRG